MPATTAVTVDLALRLVLPDSRTVAVTAELRYDLDDPYAVHATFRPASPGGPSVRWTFARALLREGLERPAGLGDVAVWPGPDGDTGETVVLALSSPNGRARFRAARRDVVAFLARTDAAVVPGRETEHLDLDRELADLLT